MNEDSRSRSNLSRRDVLAGSAVMAVGASLSRADTIAGHLPWVPNAGNPRKVQRFAPDWAAALRALLHVRIRKLLDAFKTMVALFALVLVKGHGAPKIGRNAGPARVQPGRPALHLIVGNPPRVRQFRRWQGVSTVWLGSSHWAVELSAVTFRQRSLRAIV